jgi:peptidoglycan/LPS O-acetylase OafA/YrhL/alpha-beta hydrolase superfamily lysophospholipase
MSATTADRREPAEAGYFGPPERARFGWLHRRAPSARVGLVVVPPFGYEAVCAARALRHLAEEAERAGLVALRFDLDGTGDSAGDDLDPARLDSWLDSIDDACALVRRAGAKHIVLVGVRLGALLAATAAARRDDIAGVVAIAAVPAGKALLREGSALQLALGLAPPPAGAEMREREIVGFAISDQTWDAIAALDMKAAPRAPAPRLLLIDRDDRPPNDAWAAHLRALSVEVTQLRLPGYVEMTFDPHRTVVPSAIIDATVAFARSFGESGAALVPAGPVLRDSMTLRRGTVDLREDAVWLDDKLFAIATRPPAPPVRAVILLNAGAVGRIGPNRLYVELCRRFAEEGALAIRCDLSGIGDSLPREGETENVVYHGRAVDDVAVAVRWARQAGVREIVLAGLCSGAYHALRAALSGLPIDTIVVINPLTFHYAPGAPLDVAAFRITADAARYRKSVASGASWRKLLRGDVKLSRVATVLWHSARGRIVNTAKNILRALHVPLRDDLGSELDTLARRDVAIRFVFADEDPGRAMLRDEGGTVVDQLAARGKLAIRTIEGADHTFTPRWTHASLLEAVRSAASRESASAEIPPARPSQKHVSALDGLRGIAILLVLLHGFDMIQDTNGAARAVDLLFDLGWIGVQLFFVLSGYLITGILLDTRRAATYYRSFFLRRVLRIFPLYYGVLIVAFGILPWFFAMPAGHGDHQIWLWTYLANYVAPFGYDEPAFPHFWSLCVEEQFYLVWPFLVRRGGTRGVLAFSGFLIALGVACRIFARLHFGEPTGHEIAYMATPCRADALAIGALAALAVRSERVANALRRFGSGTLLAAGLVIAGAGGLGGGIGRVAAGMQVFGYPLIALGFALMLLAALRHESPFARLLRLPLLRRCGTYSYGMYVFYAPLHLFVGLPLLARLGHPPSFVEGVGYEAVAIVATFTLGALSYHLYEKRFLDLKARVAPVGAPA